MNLERYLEQKRAREENAWRPRVCCSRCGRPERECWCAAIVPLSSRTRIAFLVHPAEARRGIATARLASKCLSNAIWIEGFAFDRDERVRDAVASSDAHAVLFPGEGARELGPGVFEGAKAPLLFVLDATWRQAKRMWRLSPDLHAMPMLSFTPSHQSRFRVRKQPHERCWSTVEATHHALAVLDGPDPRRDVMLAAFDHMVERQIAHHEQGRLRQRAR